MKQGQSQRTALHLDRRRVLLASAAAITLPALAPATAAQSADRPGEPRQEYFEAREELVGNRPVELARVKLELPRISESGNSVPLRVAVETPMAPDDYVKVVHILSEQNPYALIARFHFSPAGVAPEVQTKIRLATTQRVHAIAEMTDGSLFEGVAETVVALAACLD